MQRHNNIVWRPTTVARIVRRIIVSATASQSFGQVQNSTMASQKGLSRHTTVKLFVHNYELTPPCDRRTTIWPALRSATASQDGISHRRTFRNRTTVALPSCDNCDRSLMTAYKCITRKETCYFTTCFGFVTPFEWIFFLDYSDVWQVIVGVALPKIFSYL